MIFSHQAEKQTNYFCLECGGVVRLRSGVHRQPHFYHLKPPAHCRQSGKSMEHLQVQSFIKNLFGNDCLLEHRFSSIGRIADCVWESAKLVFEVQCSPITQKEVASRNADYEKEGYRVIWIFHDKQFNQFRLSAAELWMARHPHYFTNIDADGQGVIYDQLDKFMKGFRYRLLKPAIVDLRHPCQEASFPVFGALQRRYSHWKLSFRGDWISLSQQPEYQDHIQQTLQESIDKKKKISFLWRFLAQYVAKPYQIFFSHLLETACR